MANYNELNHIFISQSKNKYEPFIETFDNFTIVHSYYSDGNLLSSISYVDGILHGLHSTFYQTGILLCCKEYYNGKLNGSFTTFNENGTIFSESYFINGSGYVQIYNGQNICSIQHIVDNKIIYSYEFNIGTAHTVNCECLVNNFCDCDVKVLNKHIKINYNNYIGLANKIQLKIVELKVPSLNNTTIKVVVDTYLEQKIDMSKTLITFKKPENKLKCIKKINYFYANKTDRLIEKKDTHIVFHKQKTIIVL